MSTSSPSPPPGDESPVGAIRPARLRCEYLVDPIGIDVERPRLSWIVESERRDQRQTAFRVLAATSPGMLGEGSADLWDSGRVESDQTAHVEYAGPPLSGRQRAWWTVRGWDRDGEPSAWAAPACWETGILAPSEWGGAWISAPTTAPNASTPAPCPHLRRPFEATRPVASAVASATALGLYELRLNGGRIGSAVLTPGWTDYHQRIQVHTWDVTDQIRPGANVLGAILGDGWYVGNIAHVGRGQYGTYPLHLLCRLTIRYTDGSVKEIASDDHWTTATGPILASDFQDGETYDAQLEMPGWDTPGFTDDGWTPVRVTPVDGAPVAGRFVSAMGPPIEVTDHVRPVEIRETDPGVFIADLGVNLVGWCRLRARGPAGTGVVLRHGEILDEDGRLYTENLRGVKATDRYTLRGGDGDEVFEPRFTCHGFRYVEITGFPGTPGVDAIEACVVHSAMPEAGGFRCSDDLVNRIHDNLNRSLRGNFVSVPTDCPQRNERMGWTGDAQVFAPTATWNRDTASFFTKWLGDVIRAQAEGGHFYDVAPVVTGMTGGCNAWGDAGVIVPWTVYRATGDRRILETCYEPMRRWVDFLRTASDGLIRPADGYGDWLAIGSDTPREVINTAYFAHVTRRFAAVAGILGRDDDARAYDELADRIRSAFHDRFVADDGRIHGDTQTVYAIAIDFDLLDDRGRSAAAERLAADIRAHGNRLTTGFVGTASLIPALLATGHDDLFYALLLQRAFPSWGFMIDNGATTMWERWNSWSPDTGMGDAAMNSFNHYAFGAVGQWFFRAIAGIEPDPDAAGFRRFTIRPRPGGGMTSATAWHESIAGRIESAWRIEDGRFHLDVTIPANTTAEVRFPGDPAVDAVTESGNLVEAADGVRATRPLADGGYLVEIGSGEYRFSAPGPVS